MTYEPIYERFVAVGPDGSRLEVSFVRAGFLTEGDRPELFFFRLRDAGRQGGSPEGGEEAVVGISGSSMARFERSRARLSREQKIDITGCWLKRQIEAGRELDSRSLYIQDDELAHLASELDLIE